MLQEDDKKMINKQAENAIEDRKRFLQVFEKKGCNISATCIAMNMSRQTYYRWCDDIDGFKEALGDIKESIVDMAETKLLSHINDGDITSLIFFLKTKGKKRGYVERYEAEIKPVEEFERLHIYLPDNGRND